MVGNALNKKLIIKASQFMFKIRKFCSETEPNVVIEKIGHCVVWIVRLPFQHSVVQIT